MKNSTKTAAVAAVAAALVLSGCSASAGGAQGDSKSLSIYAWAGEIPDSVIAGFEAETGIDVTIDTFDSNETMIAKLEAGGSGYDIVEPSQYAVGLLADRELVQVLDQERIEGMDNIAEKFQDPSFDPGNEHSIPWAWGTTGILYNEACTGREVTSWKDLWDPQFAGKVYMLDNMLSSYIAGLQLNGHPATSVSEAEIEDATNSLLEQKSNLAGYNSTNYADLIGAGDACIAQAYSGTVSATAVEANPDVKFILPTEGGTLWTDSFSIVNDSDAVDAAYEWINYTLRPEVAALVTDDANLASTNGAALEVVANQDLVKNPAIYAPEDQLTNAEFITDPGSALSFYQSGWTRVRAS